MKITEIIIIAFLLLCACSDNIVKKEKISDLAELNLKGSVKKVIEYENKKEKQNGVYSTITFNTLGNIEEKTNIENYSNRLERYTYWDNEVLKSIDMYVNDKLIKQLIYNESGKLVEERSISQDYKTGENVIAYANKYTYNIDGTEAFGQKEGEEFPFVKYVYDKAGSIISEIAMDGNEVDFEKPKGYKYDKRGNIIEEDFYYIKKTDNINNKNVLEEKKTYKYNEQNLLIESNFYVNKARPENPKDPNSNIIWELESIWLRVLTYDNYNNLIQSTTNDHTPTTYRYLYDMNGNWIYRSSGTNDNAIEREIEYYIAEKNLDEVRKKQSPIIAQLVGSWKLIGEKENDKNIDCSNKQCSLIFTDISPDGKECELEERYGDEVSISNFSITDTCLIMTLLVAGENSGYEYKIKSISADKLIISLTSRTEKEIEHEYTFGKIN